MPGRESPAPKPAPTARPKRRRGRPRQDELRAKEPRRLLRQASMTLEEMLEDLPKVCDIGVKGNAKRHQESWAVSKALHGDDPDCVSAWAEARCAQLEQGRLDELLNALRSAASCEEARRCFEYVERNRDRMRYADFRAAGLCIGSGVVEAGCKTVVGNRLKRAGIHWTVEGANAILALRYRMLSGRYEEFWEHRSTLGSKAISES